MPRDVMGKPQMSKEDKERERRWRAEDDFRTLGRAAEIHGDEDRKAAVIEMHQEHADMLKTLFAHKGESHKADNMKSEDQSASGSKKPSAGHVTEKKGGASGGETAKEKGAKEKSTGKDAYYGRKRS